MNVEQIRARIGHPIIDSDGHLIEYLPVVRDILREQAGEAAVKGLDFVTSAGQFMRSLTRDQMRASGFTRSPWWGLPTRNSLDRGTALLPALLAERLDEIGIDHAVLYPTYGLVPPNLDDTDLRRATSRAFNTFYAEEFRDLRHKLTPVGIIPMHTPEEALAELEHATGVLGLDTFMFGGPILRPTPGVEHRAGRWLDTLGVDSQYDYDPVWTRCAELDIAPTFHTPSMGWATHSSPTNYVYNHIGMFATGGEAVARSLFLGGVLHRFPTLRFAFLEGGVAWGASLYSGLIGHIEKRNREAVQHYNPAYLDRKLLIELFRKYGSDRYRARLDQLEDGLRFLSDPDETNLDEFAQSGVQSAEDIKQLLTERFYFGCEADDPLTAVAFDSDRHPLGARLKPIFASDIGHWDVPDIREVLPEAWELVEHGHIDEGEFRAFMYENARALWPQLAKYVE
jgi:predicted TIM-barrel fold metal-dependent hydrolase